MVIYILMSFAAISFILGIIFIIKGSLGSKGESPAEPIADLAQIRDTKGRESEVEILAKNGPLEKQPKTLSNYLLNENLKIKTDIPIKVVEEEIQELDEPQVIQPLSSLKAKEAEIPVLSNEDHRKEINALERQITDLKDHLDIQYLNIAALNEKLAAQSASQAQEIEILTSEKQKIADALQRELSSKELKTIAAEEKERLVEIEKNFHKAKESIGLLTEANARLESELAGKKSALKELQVKYENFDAQREELERDYQTRMAGLQHAATQYGRDREAWDKEKEHIHALKAENEKFKTEQNNHLSALESVKEAYEQKIKILEAKIEFMRSEGQQEIRSQSETINAQLQESTNMVSALTQEKNDWIKLHAEMETNLAKLKSVNTNLQGKEKMLHYELAKTRAQVAGLEKICEDFKYQIEEQARAEKNT